MAGLPAPGFHAEALREPPDAVHLGHRLAARLSSTGMVVTRSWLAPCSALSCPRRKRAAEGYPPRSYIDRSSDPATSCNRASALFRLDTSSSVSPRFSS